MPFNAEVTCKNGKKRAVEIHDAVLDDGFLGAFVDVSERRRAHRRERAVQAILRDISRMFLTPSGPGLDAAIDAALTRIGTCLCAHRCYLFRRVDQALYAAKDQGRDRCVLG